MSTAPRIALVLAACLPWLGGCARSSADAAAPDLPGRVDVHTVAQSLLERLAEEQRHIRIVNDEVVEPAVFGTLVRMGSEAVPSILDVVASTPDTGYRDLLIDILGRIGDARARPALESLLGDAAARTAALDAVGRLGKPESLPALRQLLASVEPRERVHVLEAMHRVGDTSVVEDLLRIGLADEEQRFAVVRALLRHTPLRVALGFPTPFREGTLEFFDDALFLRAADEWHHEAVLGRPSPWRPVPPQFTEPFADEKRAAFDELAKAAARDNCAFDNLRVHGVDPLITEADARRDVTIVTGDGHAGSLVLHVWCAERDPVVGFRLDLQHVPACTEFPQDDASVRCERITLDRAAYGALVAGMRAALEARLVPWWNGPDFGSWSSSGNFVVAIDGIAATDAAPRHYCGYPGGDRIRYQRLQAAAQWHDRFVAERTTIAAQQLTRAGKHHFSALFRRQQSLWNEGWWWVRERMVEMARDAGDDTLRDALVPYLAPTYSEGRHSELRTAAAAINALAAITGTDLRFQGDGASRLVADVAAAYRQLLAR